MPLHAPKFFIRSLGNGQVELCHNLNGALDFCASAEVDERIVGLLELAIEEGKRQKAEEIRKALHI